MNLTKSNIRAIAAITIDGKIARHAGHFTDWTSPEDKASLYALIDESDAIVLGNNTYKTAAGRLSKRNCIVFTRSIESAERHTENLLYYNPSRALPIQALLGAHQTVAVLGGTQVYSYFLERDLIDELYLTIEPIVFGEGLDLFSHQSEAVKRFHLVSIRALNKMGTVLLHYRRPS